MGQTWWETISCTLGSSIIIIHIVALIFLKISKYSNRHKNQVLIITSLSILELTGTVLLIGYFLFTYFELLVMADIAFCFTKTFTPFSFHFIMIFLTIDTFLVFYLNLKYSLYFSFSNIRKWFSASFYFPCWLLLPSLFWFHYKRWPGCKCMMYCICYILYLMMVTFFLQ